MNFHKTKERREKKERQKNREILASEGNLYSLRCVTTLVVPYCFFPIRWYQSYQKMNLSIFAAQKPESMSDEE
ncbi:hypothetical protein CR513_01963, partial [Mucuna pruriens]